MGGAVFPPCYLPGAKLWCFPCGSDGKESTCNVGGLGSIPGMGRSPGEGKGYLYTEYSSILAWRLGYDWATFTLFHFGIWYCVSSILEEQQEISNPSSFTYQLLLETKATVHTHSTHSPLFLVQIRHQAQLSRWLKAQTILIEINKQLL